MAESDETKETVSAVARRYALSPAAAIRPAPCGEAATAEGPSAGVVLVVVLALPLEPVARKHEGSRQTV